MKILKNLFKMITIGVAITPIFTVHAVEYGGIGGRPAYPISNNSRTQSIFIHTLEPGVTKQEGVTVINNTQDTKTIRIYATDSTPSTDGAFACKQMSEQKNSVGSWINLEQGEVILGPMSSQIVPFTIAVPIDVDTGEHNGCILIQEKKEKVEGISGASLSIRTGLRVAVTVPGEIIRKLELINFNFLKSDEKIILSPQVKNSGNVSIDTNVQVITKNIFGGMFQKHGGMYPILRGQTSDWNFELRKSFWGGIYRSYVTVDYDQNKDVQVGSDSSGKKTQIVSESITFVLPPSRQGLAIELGILAILIAGIIVIVSNKKKMKNIIATWVPYTVLPGDSINTIADTHSIDWKMIARINHIKAPYVITPGTIIKTPPIQTIQETSSEPVVKKKVVRKKKLV